MRPLSRPDSLSLLRDQIVTAQILDDLVCDSTLSTTNLDFSGDERLSRRNLGDAAADNLFLQSTRLGPARVDHHSKMYYRPLLELPAARWTNLPTSDTVASHLISVFLTGPNPYWRFIEDDLFIRDLQQMRPGQSNSSSNCTELLVNAVLAFACVSEARADL
jgi:hypothetical protein